MSATTAPAGLARVDRSRQVLRTIGTAAASSSAIVTLLLVWWVAGAYELVDPFLLPPLPDVLGRLWDDVAGGAFALNAWLTFYRSVVGFAIATVIGIPVGILVARGVIMRWFCEPLISIGFPMPKIAFLPIFILWFGVYDFSKIVMVAFASIFTIVAAAEVGMRGVEKFLIWSARSMGTLPVELFFRVILPAAMPQILTGLQIALPTALITEVASEMLMGGAGLGRGDAAGRALRGFDGRLCWHHRDRGGRDGDRRWHGAAPPLAAALASGVQSTLARRILYGLDRPPRGVAWDHPRVPSVVLDEAPLRLNSFAVPPAILAGGTERASRLAAVQAWLAQACGDYARARVQFVSAYLAFARAAPTGPEMDARIARFSGLFAAEDWTWSALRPLPRAWIEGPSGAFDGRYRVLGRSAGVRDTVGRR